MKTLRAFRIALVFSVLSLTLPAVEQIRNGTFTEGLRSWFLLVNGDYRAPDVIAPFVSSTTEGLTLMADEIPGEKTKPASVILAQRLPNLRDGVRYVLRLEIKGHKDEVVLVGLGNPVNEGPNKGNLSAGIPLKELRMDNTWQIHEFPFVYNQDHSLSLPGDAKDTQLQFRLGKMTTFHIRKVSLSEVTSP